MGMMGGMGPAGAMPTMQGRGGMGAMMGQGMMGQGIMGRGMMGGPMMSPERIEGRLAFLRTELKITNEQMPQWNAFADALRANSKAMQETYAAAPPTSGDALAMLDRHERMLTQHLEAMRRVKTVLAPLYAAFSPEQKQTADQLLGHGMM
jgi:hypothetical protein